MKSLKSGILRTTSNSRAKLDQFLYNDRKRAPEKIGFQQTTFGIHVVGELILFCAYDGRHSDERRRSTWFCIAAFAVFTSGKCIDGSGVDAFFWQTQKFRHGENRECFRVHHRVLSFRICRAFWVFQQKLNRPQTKKIPRKERFYLRPFPTILSFRLQQGHSCLRAQLFSSANPEFFCRAPNAC